MKLILPILLAVFGLAGGLAGGFMLKPAPPAEEMEMAEDGAKAEGEKTAAGDMADKENAGDEADKDKKAAKKPKKPKKTADGEAPAVDYVKLDSQFVVPVIKNEEVESLMVISMALEVQPGLEDTVYQREPRLRDSLLQVLFRHSESGAFGGAFTSPDLMNDLRDSLLYAAQEVLGDAAYAVLLTNIIRQDL